ncbi:CAP domain-containing protein [Carboxydochorda subterranea]|uniref:CAP domain-containing protein n=1 Tax=Carboxydichorda subterranea TaxID=3109565 RepID=A0ABZ1BVD7_9FIRM|nr:CAP domain-containing protein [Limnochorda sp. L945t]WRP16649.1 CAP domain-containing protein [Limnochorda sp. L945t]
MRMRLPVALGRPPGVLLLAAAVCLVLTAPALAATWSSSGSGTWRSAPVTSWQPWSSWSSSPSGTYTWRPGTGSGWWTSRPGTANPGTWYPAPQPPSTQPQPPQPQPPRPPESSPVVDPASEETLASLVNQARAASGLAPLSVDPTLRELARRKSLDMIQRNYFGHDSPTWGGLAQLLAMGNVHYIYAGENLAGAPSAQSAHQSLMNSPAHRANILNVHYTHMGIGVVRGGPYGLMVTELFVGR